MEIAAFQQVDWFSRRRLFEPTGDRLKAELNLGRRVERETRAMTAKGSRTR